MLEQFCFKEDKTNIKRAMFIVDPDLELEENLNSSGGRGLERPSFPGPTRVRESARKRNDKIFYRGADNCKEHGIKPWRYEFTEIPTNADRARCWLCLVLPFDADNKRKKGGKSPPAQQPSIPSAAGDLPEGLRGKSRALVDEIVETLDRDGRLRGATSRGDEFRAEMNQRLEKLIGDCLSEGRKKP